MQTDAEERVALEALVPELGRLQNIFGASNARIIESLWNFRMDNADLQQLGEMLAEAKANPAEFDLFEIIRPSLWEYEDVHSNIVAWMLDPSGSHGVKDYFLKRFLMATTERANALGIVSDNSEDHINRIDRIEASVTQERWLEVAGQWGRLDILILDQGNKFLCAIENKIFSQEGFDDYGRSQLTHYREALEKDWPNFSRHHVFLSPKGMLPHDQIEQGFWVPENYTTILELAEQAIADDIKMREDVRVFLRQYVFVLRRKIVPDNGELQQLARKIYLEHREVVELIYRTGRPDYQADSKQIFREIIAEREGWEADREAASLIRFRPYQ